MACLCDTGRTTLGLATAALSAVADRDHREPGGRFRSFPQRSGAANRRMPPASCDVSTGAVASGTGAGWLLVRAAPLVSTSSSSGRERPQLRHRHDGGGAEAGQQGHAQDPGTAAQPALEHVDLVREEADIVAPPAFELLLGCDHGPALPPAPTPPAPRHVPAAAAGAEGYPVSWYSSRFGCRNNHDHQPLRSRLISRRAIGAKSLDAAADNTPAN